MAIFKANKANDKPAKGVKDQADELLVKMQNLVPANVKDKTKNGFGVAVELLNRAKKEVRDMLDSQKQEPAEEELDQLEEVK